METDTEKPECPAGFAPASGSDAELLARIQNYLGNGGLFNPEMMEHDKVRDLIMDCRTAIERHLKVPSAMKAAKRLAAGNYTNWNNAGGGKECEHGYNEGIPCPACDLALVNECLEREHQNAKLRCARDGAPGEGGAS